MTETSDKFVLTREVHDSENDPIDGLVKSWSPPGNESVKRKSWRWNARRQWDSAIWKNWEVSQRACEEEAAEAGALATWEPASRRGGLAPGSVPKRSWIRDEALPERGQSRRASLELVSTALLIFGLVYFVIVDPSMLGAHAGDQPVKMFITGLTAGVLLATLRLKTLAFEQDRELRDVEAESRLERLCSYLPQSASLVRLRARNEASAR